MSPVTAKRVTDNDLLEQTGPGAFQYIEEGSPDGPTGLMYVCPCGCGDVGALVFRKGKNADKHPTWVWDGNLDQPTLTPSILRTLGCKWHGFLTKGEFVRCG